MIGTPQQRYQQSSVQTASPAKLLLMLYDGAIRFVKIGIEGIEQHDIEKTNTNLSKAQSIINELICTLNFDYEVSNSLQRLYEYMNYLLIQANTKKEKEPAEEALGYLMDLRMTWQSASELVGV